MAQTREEMRAEIEANRRADAERRAAAADAKAAEILNRKSATKAASKEAAAGSRSAPAQAGGSAVSVTADRIRDRNKRNEEAAREAERSLYGARQSTDHMN